MVEVFSLSRVAIRRNDVIVIRIHPSRHDEADVIAQMLVKSIRRSTGHEVTVIVVSLNESSFDHLDEEQMRAHGWVRAEE